MQCRNILLNNNMLFIRQLRVCLIVFHYIDHSILLLSLDFRFCGAPLRIYRRYYFICKVIFLAVVYPTRSEPVIFPFAVQGISFPIQYSIELLNLQGNDAKFYKIKTFSVFVCLCFNRQPHGMKYLNRNEGFRLWSCVH